MYSVVQLIGGQLFVPASVLTKNAEPRSHNSKRFFSLHDLLNNSDPSSANKINTYICILYNKIYSKILKISQHKCIMYVQPCHFHYSQLFYSNFKMPAFTRRDLFKWRHVANLILTKTEARRQLFATASEVVIYTRQHPQIHDFTTHTLRQPLRKQRSSSIKYSC